MDYSKFFMQAPRLNSKKTIALLRGEMFAEFIDTIAKDESLDLEYRAFLICAVSAGLRVEEALSLTRESFEVDGEVLQFKVKVLKKRREETRWCFVHPMGKAVVERVLKEKIGKLFNWTQCTALNRAKKFFPVEGICSHSWRHSAVSYFLFHENFSIAETAKFIHVTTDIIDHYSHLDERKLFKKMFKQA